MHATDQALLDAAAETTDRWAPYAEENRRFWARVGGRHGFSDRSISGR